MTEEAEPPVLDEVVEIPFIEKRIGFFKRAFTAFLRWFKRVINI